MHIIVIVHAHTCNYIEAKELPESALKLCLKVYVKECVIPTLSIEMNLRV